MHHDVLVHILRFRGERQLEACIVQRYTGSTANEIVWVIVTFNLQSSLQRTDDILASERYVMVVPEAVVPHLQMISAAVYQQHNTRPHVTRNIQHFLQVASPLVFTITKFVANCTYAE